MTNVSIVPVVKELTKLQILGVNVSLNRDAYLSASLVNDEGVKISYTLYMDTQTYEQWGSDDEFVINWTLDQLGLQKA